jgi:hypothetical protein
MVMPKHGYFTAIANPVTTESGFMTECLDFIKLYPVVNFT